MTADDINTFESYMQNMSPGPNKDIVTQLIAMVYARDDTINDLNVVIEDYDEKIDNLNSDYSTLEEDNSRLESELNNLHCALNMS